MMPLSFIILVAWVADKRRIQNNPKDLNGPFTSQQLINNGHLPVCIFAARGGGIEK